jgi:hypothetical protein
MTVKRDKAMCIDSRASETDLPIHSDLSGSTEIADAIDEAYWAQLLDDAYRLQLETADEESDVDEELEP